MTTAAVLEIDRLHVARGARRVVDDVSMSVMPGEILIVMGENGAGKSTLLHAIAGDLPPASGEIRLDQRPLFAWSTREQARRRAVLPQHSAVSLAFTALEIVLLGRSPHCGGNPGAHDRAVARDALQRTDAGHLAGRDYLALSGGEQARVMLARVFAQVARGPDDRAPRLLLLDEPTASLDIAHRHSAWRAIRDLAARESVAVVAVLHDPNLAALFADRIALLRHGRLLAIGSVDETLTESAMSACFSVPMRRLRHPTRDVPMLVALPD